MSEASKIGGLLSNGSNLNYNNNNSNNNGNATNLIGAILGPGGAGGAFSGVGDIICSIKGNCTPKVVNYNTGGNGGRNNILLLVIVGIVVFGLAFFMFRK